MPMESEPLFPPLARDALSQRIARILTDAIVSGQLKPGDRVAESVIARDLGVSRAPVREAGRLLESAGLLVSKANRGFFVRTIDAEDLDALYELRLCIEREAAARVVREGRLADILDPLRALIEQMVALSAEKRLMHQIVVDLQFHRLIVETSGNQRFLAVFDKLASEIQACTALIERVFDEPGMIARNHYLIIEALETGDPEQARSAMDYHIGVARKAVVEHFRKLEAEGGA
ncbi:transcriptional regulator, GntR family [Roseovarius litoreus]|uniref:Transcriptional regulator, GntR family n=1 Tax=Roseovarius litoreus TaxID=1155722 RepID=A0A1M7D6Q7_9RHOB|nr:GntR family transcriptional regulator [Roseovarius litoreus]SHL75087.1 transcriptional regulator, GntR family [Roseovarius litoreus]